MAILVASNGKFAETNKGAMRQQATAKGDKVEFLSRGAYEQVRLNGNILGDLFPSHESAIKYLAAQKQAAAAPKTRAMRIAEGDWEIVSGGKKTIYKGVAAAAAQVKKLHRAGKKYTWRSLVSE